MPVARHEGVVMVSLWCCHGSLRVANSTPVEVAVVACTFGSLALAAERRLQPDARQNWLGASMFEVLPICAKIAQIHTHPADIDMNEASDEILTIDEVAAYLKAGRRTVYRLAANGQIPAFKLGGTWRFRRTELDRWIAGRIDTHGRSKPDGVET